MANNKDFKVKNGILSDGYLEGIGTISSGTAGYSLGTAVYDDVNFSVVSEEATSTGLFFKPDGTKLYVCGAAGDDVNEYNLSTAWDLSTATYNQNFSVAAQELSPGGVFFKSDGTKMYIVGLLGGDILEYTLSTAWDVSTASYTQNFSVSSQEVNPSGIYFKPDGTKMYHTGDNSDAVHEYDLSTAWDVSSASFLQTFSVSTQEGNPKGVFFKSDGTKMYICGGNSDSAHEYNLSTAWDISTATYSVGFSVTTEENTPRSISFKSDGTKMYIIGNQTNKVHQYSTTIDTKTLDLSTGSVFEVPITDPARVSFSNAPTSTDDVVSTVLLEQQGGDTFYIQDLSEIDSTFYLNPTGLNYTYYGLEFKPDGTKMYVSTTSSVMLQYSLSTAWDLTTASYDSVSASITSSAAGLKFKSDGTRCFVVSYNGGYIYEYDLSTAWDISTLTYNSVGINVSSRDTQPWDMDVSSDGTKLYFAGNSTDNIYQYDLSTAWDLSTASFTTGNTFTSTQTSNLAGCALNNDGTALFGTDYSSSTMYKYDLSTAYDITTASYSGISTSAISNGGYSSPFAFTFKPDGSSVFIATGQDYAIKFNTKNTGLVEYDSAISFTSTPSAPSLFATDILTFKTTDGGTSFEGGLAMKGAK